MDTNIAIAKLKKLPFSKSWQNTHVSKTKNIVNFATGKVEPTDIEIFVYVPAPSIIQAFSSDRDFLNFRLENKTGKAFEYNLLADKAENNNRRIAIQYVSELLNEFEIKFLIDDSYTLYITDEELKKIAHSGIQSLKEFYNSLYVPKHTVIKKGREETWSN